MNWIAGVDGCPGGWLAAFAHLDTGEHRIRVVARFADILQSPEAPHVVAVDMPIGLPDRIGPAGRAPERLVRPRLGGRQSSVFSVPSRAAINAGDYRDACARALATSDPPRKVSKQLWNIAPKIREIDALLCATRDLRARVFESHPEVAFWRMNGGCPLDLPKKVKSRPFAPGLDLRARLLRKDGIAAAAVGSAPPRGAARDDLLDALACLVVARRIVAAHAVSFPDPPDRDGFGLPIAIWA